MLHNIVKLAERYVKSVNRRKSADLNSENFTLVLQLTSEDESGIPVLVTNTIQVRDGRPVEYSERLSTMEGMTLSFIVGRTDESVEKGPKPKPVSPENKETTEAEKHVAEDVNTILTTSAEETPVEPPAAPVKKTSRKKS